MGDPATNGNDFSTSQNGEHDFDRLKDIPSCPPADSAPKDGTFFAFHDSDPPDQSDFQTAAERDAFPDLDPCLRRSNSIWDDLTALQRKLKQLKRRHGLLHPFISAGKVKKEHGVFAPGVGPHFSFWICGKHSMHAIFTKRVI